MRAVPADAKVRSPALKRSRKFAPKAARSSVPLRLVRWLLILVALVVVVDSLLGERGILETVRARRDFASLERHVSRLKQENAALREEARRLREDPATIEAIARKELGLIYPGETLFIVNDRTKPQ